MQQTSTNNELAALAACYRLLRSLARRNAEVLEPPNDAQIDTHEEAKGMQNGAGVRQDSASAVPNQQLTNPCMNKDGQVL